MLFRGHNVSRRQFALLGTAAVVSPLRAHAQAPLRRIGPLSSLSESDAATQADIRELCQWLRELGWIEGRNLTIEYRFTGADPARLLSHAQELAQLNLDVILSRATPPTAAMTRRIRGGASCRRRRITPRSRPG